MKLFAFVLILLAGIPSVVLAQDIDGKNEQHDLSLEESDKAEEMERHVRKDTEQAELLENSTESKWHFVLGFGYLLSPGEGTFDGVTYTDNTPTFFGGQAKFEYEPTYSIIIEGRNTPKHSWGFAGGLKYEGEREFESGTITGGGDTITLSGGSGASKIQFISLYANAVYRWNSFYIPFGLNYTSVKFEPAVGFTGTHSENGGIGAQLGVGWMFDNHFAVELYSWATGIKMKSSTSTATIDYGTGYFSSLLFLAKYSF